MITSIQNETIKSLMKLKQKKYRDETGFFLVEGYHLVEEAMKYQCAIKIITTEDIHYDIETVQVSQNIMNRLAFTKTPQPIMALCQNTRNFRKWKEISFTRSCSRPRKCWDNYANSISSWL